MAIRLTAYWRCASKSQGWTGGQSRGQRIGRTVLGLQPVHLQTSLHHHVAEFQDPVRISLVRQSSTADVSSPNQEVSSSARERWKEAFSGSCFEAEVNCRGFFTRGFTGESPFQRARMPMRWGGLVAQGSTLHLQRCLVLFVIRCCMHRQDALRVRRTTRSHVRH